MTQITEATEQATAALSLLAHLDRAVLSDD